MAKAKNDNTNPQGQDRDKNGVIKGSALDQSTSAGPPENDNLQEKREEVANDGMAHGSFNQYRPQKASEHSDASKEGDKALERPDNSPKE